MILEKKQKHSKSPKKDKKLPKYLDPYDLSKL